MQKYNIHSLFRLQSSAWGQPPSELGLSREPYANALSSDKD